MKPEFSRQIFEKSSIIKFNQNPPSWSRVVACEHTTDGHEAFRNFHTRLKTVDGTECTESEKYAVQLLSLCFD